MNLRETDRPGTDRPGVDRPGTAGPGDELAPVSRDSPDSAVAAVASIDAVGPNMGHMLLLLVLSTSLLAAGQFLALLAVQQSHVYGHHTLRGYAELVQDDARWLIPSQLLSYGLVLLAAMPLFRAIWHRTFATGLHWNGMQARRYFGRLLLLGLGCGFGIALLGSWLPMPKDPPIMADLLHSSLGAWMMLVFGVSVAPLFEEMFFRGFLLPAFLNAFRWLSLRGDLSPAAVEWLGVPLSVVFTSLPFALLHSRQVSHAWAPVLLIGIVSLVLCLVRLRLNSLASSTVVHAAYNFTLFAGILVQTGGFRHLDRLVH